jgi:hypothetical protein
MSRPRRGSSLRGMELLKTQQGEIFLPSVLRGDIKTTFVRSINQDADTPGEEVSGERLESDKNF